MFSSTSRDDGSLWKFPRADQNGNCDGGAATAKSADVDMSHGEGLVSKLAQGSSPHDDSYGGHDNDARCSREDQHWDGSSSSSSSCSGRSDNDAASSRLPHESSSASSQEVGHTQPSHALNSWLLEEACVQYPDDVGVAYAEALAVASRSALQEALDISIAQLLPTNGELGQPFGMSTVAESMRRSVAVPRRLGMPGLLRRPSRAESGRSETSLVDPQDIASHPTLPDYKRRDCVSAST